MHLDLCNLPQPPSGEGGEGYRGGDAPQGDAPERPQMSFEVVQGCPRLMGSEARLEKGAEPLGGGGRIPVNEEVLPALQCLGQGPLRGGGGSRGFVTAGGARNCPTREDG